MPGRCEGTTSWERESLRRERTLETAACCSPRECADSYPSRLWLPCLGIRTAGHVWSEGLHRDKAAMVSMALSANIASLWNVYAKRLDSERPYTSSVMSQPNMTEHIDTPRVESLTAFTNLECAISLPRNTPSTSTPATLIHGSSTTAERISSRRSLLILLRAVQTPDVSPEICLIESVRS